MPAIRRTLLINTDPNENPQAFLSQLNLALQQVMEQVDIIFGDRGESSISSDLDMNNNSIINVGGISGSGINFDGSAKTTTSWKVDGVEYATMGYSNDMLPVFDFWEMESLGTLVMRGGPDNTPLATMGRLDSKNLGQGIINTIGLQILPGEHGQFAVWGSDNREKIGFNSWWNEFTVGTDGTYGLFAVNSDTGSLSIGDRTAVTNYTFPTARGSALDALVLDADGLLGWTSIGAFEIDTLTSATTGYTLTLTDDGTDMTLAGSDGDLYIEAAGDVYLDSAIHGVDRLETRDVSMSSLILTDDNTDQTITGNLGNLNIDAFVALSLQANSTEAIFLESTQITNRLESIFEDNIHSETAASCGAITTATIDGSPITYGGNTYSDDPIGDCSGCGEAVYSWWDGDFEETICCNGSTANISAAWTSGSWSVGEDIDLSLICIGTFGSYITVVSKSGEGPTIATTIDGWFGSPGTTTCDAYATVWTWNASTCSYGAADISTVWTWNGSIYVEDTTPGTWAWATGCTGTCSGNAFPSAPVITVNSTPKYTWQIEESTGEAYFYGDSEFAKDLSVGDDLNVVGTGTINETLGVGTAATVYDGAKVTNSSTSTGNDLTAMRFSVTNTPTSTQTSSIAGVIGSAEFAGSQQLQAPIFGVSGQASISGSTSANAAGQLYGNWSVVNNGSSGDAVYAYPYHADVYLTSSGDFTGEAVYYYAAAPTFLSTGEVTGRLIGFLARDLTHAQATGDVFGFASETDSIMYDDVVWWFGTDLDIGLSSSTAGQLDVTPPDNTDITLNFAGTTNQGTIIFMEDEDLFAVYDDVALPGDYYIKLGWHDDGDSVYETGEYRLALSASTDSQLNFTPETTNDDVALHVVGSGALVSNQDLSVTGALDATSLEVGGATNYASIASDGEINLHGTGRVYKHEWLSLGAMKAPGTKPAGETDYGISGAFTFDDSDDETVVATIRLPQDMDRTVAPEIKLGWGAAATTGDVVWQVEYLYRAPSEALDAAADDTLETTTTVSGTSDGLTISTLAMAVPGATDQLLLLRIKRLGADGDDDLSGDAYLVGCGMKYTADKLGAAL